MYRNWIIQKTDNVIIAGWEVKCSPRFFVLDVPRNAKYEIWVKVSCYSSGNSDYEVGNSYYKRVTELKRI